MAPPPPAEPGAPDGRAAKKAAQGVPPAPAKTAAETLKALGLSRDTGLTGADAGARLEKQGPNEVPEKRSRPILRFARKFWGLSAWMIELIALLSFILHKRADVVIALSLLVGNALLSFFQEQRASAAVGALRKKLQVTARVLRDRGWQALPARQLVTGDVVRVRAGDFVPADVQLFDGALRVDQSALTGESREVDKATNDALYTGSTVRDGEATGVVMATGAGTYFGRTTQLVESAHPKLHVEAVTSRVVRWLLLIVGALVAVTFVTALARGLPLVEILPVALVLLMSAVPVALPVMFTVSMAVGSMELGRHGVLITRLSAIEDAANMDVLCADKTGTLTMNQLSLTGAVPQQGFTESDVVAPVRWRRTQPTPIPSTPPSCARPGSASSKIQGRRRSRSPRSPRRPAARKPSSRWAASRRAWSRERCARWRRLRASTPRRSPRSKRARTRKRGRASAPSPWLGRTATARCASAAWLSSTMRRAPSRDASSTSCTRSASGS